MTFYETVKSNINIYEEVTMRSGRNKRLGLLMLLLMVAVLITACGEGGEGNSAHNKGTDCLGCHGFSLAATIYQDATNNAPCNGTLHVRFLDPVTKAVVINSATSGDVTSSGNFYVGGGYITGNYDAQIISGDGTILAQSVLPHTFTTGYNAGNPADMNNRYSCNTCHRSPNPLNGAAGSLFVQQNLNKCQ